jgi:PIN domain nuclease of toxin-antitoxin system
VKLLLDTHSFIWFIEDNPFLSLRARTLIEEPTSEVFLSITGFRV